jgi:predicted transport protein
MDPAVYSNGIKLQKQKFNLEDDLEREVSINSKKLFGAKTIYLDTKKKIETVSLGGSIPDGILFDLEDPEDIKFYLVEVELSKHSFYEHIFPQITKFLAFYKNPAGQNILIEKIHSFIIKDEEIKNEFERLLEGQELYKSIKDAVENNQNILLIIDGIKPEIEEAQRVYTDTWDKLVILEILTKYKSGEKEVFILEPDFSREKLILEKEESEGEQEGKITYTENYHLEGVSPLMTQLYAKIMNYMVSIDPKIKPNPQKYYISLRKNRNFAYLDIKRKKIKIAVMLPYEKGEEMISHHRLRRFTPGIERFYGRSSFEVTVENKENLDEVLKLLEEAHKDQEEI